MILMHFFSEMEIATVETTAVALRPFAESHYGVLLMHQGTTAATICSDLTYMIKKGDFCECIHGICLDAIAPVARSPHGTTVRNV